MKALRLIALVAIASTLSACSSGSSKSGGSSTSTGSSTSAGSIADASSDFVDDITSGSDSDTTDTTGSYTDTSGSYTDTNGSYDDGYNAGYNDGYYDGDGDGYDDGYNDGYTDGDAYGYNDGYNDGYDDGYYTGYDDGYYDGSWTYEKNRGAPKDRLKMAAAEEQQMLQNAQTALSAQFGLSQERSFEVAKLAVIWKKTPKERKTAADYDKMATQVIGHSVSEIQMAVQKKFEGQGTELNQIIEDAADLNGVTPEHMNIIMDKMFGTAWH